MMKVGWKCLLCIGILTWLGVILQACQPSDKADQKRLISAMTYVRCVAFHYEELIKSGSGVQEAVALSMQTATKSCSSTAGVDFRVYPLATGVPALKDGAAEPLLFVTFKVDGREYSGFVDTQNQISLYERAGS